jgi:hypothetical protein
MVEIRIHNADGTVTVRQHEPKNDLANLHDILTDAEHHCGYDPVEYKFDELIATYKLGLMIEEVIKVALKEARS